MEQKLVIDLLSALVTWAMNHTGEIMTLIVSVLAYFKILEPLKTKISDSKFEQAVKLAYSFASWSSRVGLIRNGDKVATAIKKLDEYLVLFNGKAAKPEDISKALAMFTAMHEDETIDLTKGTSLAIKAEGSVRPETNVVTKAVVPVAPSPIDLAQDKGLSALVDAIRKKMEEDKKAARTSSSVGGGE
jgi:hypothetical protein